MAIFDHIVDLVDEFLTDCAFEATSEDEISSRGRSTSKVLELLDPEHFDRQNDFIEQITDKDGNALADQFLGFIETNRRASFTLGMILAARITGAAPAALDRIRQEH